MVYSSRGRQYGRVAPRGKKPFLRVSMGYSCFGADETGAGVWLPAFYGFDLVEKSENTNGISGKPLFKPWQMSITPIPLPHNELANHR